VFVLKMKMLSRAGVMYIDHDGDPAPLPQKGAEPPFSAHICRGQVAGWIKMPLGREVGLILSNIVLDWDPSAPPFQKGTEPPSPYFQPISVVAKWLDGSRCHLVGR